VIDFFLRRPVFATVCSLVILLLGIVAIPNLPIAQFPNIAPPTVTVTAEYTGASAEAVEASVTTPLENAINSVQAGHRSQPGGERRAERRQPRARRFAQ
jgi:HAE1 family hydrophobic/amphiphilic exporter-1